jgi:hypothetical protein
MCNNAMQSKYKHFTDGGSYVSKGERNAKNFKLTRSNKTLNVNPKSPCFCRPLAFSQLKVKTKKHHYLGSLSKIILKAK